MKQVARTGTRKLFDASRKAVFLEWFAATCNVVLSAEKAGVRYQTVFKHRAADDAFAEAWDAALAQGYASLEAGLLDEALRGRPSTTLGMNGEEEGDEGEHTPAPAPAPAPAHPQPLPQAGGEVLERLSFERRLALLREFRRGSGVAAPKDARRAEKLRRLARDDEVEAALTRRLKSFAIRVVGDGQIKVEPSEREPKR